MKKLNKIRLSMAVLLCMGVLLIGIGFGIGFGEAAEFTYAGSKMLRGSTSNTITREMELYHEDDNVYIYISSLNSEENIEDCLVTSEDVKPGTIRIEADYRSVFSSPDVFHIDYGSEEGLNLNWDEPFMEVFFAFKDIVLEDIRNGQLGEYREHEYTNVVITVNPADEDRILFRDIY